MSRVQVSLLGALILISFVLTCIATLSGYWITWATSSSNMETVHGHFGVVPWSLHDTGLFNAACWCIFVAVLLYLPLFVLFIFSAFKVFRNGCSHGVRMHFFAILVMCLMIASLQVATFILVAINAARNSFSYIVYSHTYTVKESLGYASFIAVVSGVLMAFATVLAGNIAKRHCR